MAKVIVRGLEDDAKTRRKRRAERHGRSRAPVKLGSRIAARFRKVGLTADLPELRGKRSPGM